MSFSFQVTGLEMPLFSCTFAYLNNRDMISFFRTPSQSIIAVESSSSFSVETIEKLTWLFGNASLLTTETIHSPSLDHVGNDHPVEYMCRGDHAEYGHQWHQPN